MSNTCDHIIPYGIEIEIASVKILGYIRIKKWCLLWNFMHCLWVYVSVMNDFVCHIWDLNSLPSFNLTPTMTTTERWSRRRPRAWTVSVCRLPEAIILIKISHFLIGKLLKFVNTFFLLHHKLRPSGEEFNLSITGFWWLLVASGYWGVGCNDWECRTPAIIYPQIHQVVNSNRNQR